MIHRQAGQRHISKKPCDIPGVPPLGYLLNGSLHCDAKKAVGLESPLNGGRECIERVGIDPNHALAIQRSHIGPNGGLASRLLCESAGSSPKDGIGVA